MAQTACPHCGTPNQALAPYCVRCQRPLDAAAQPPREAAPIRGLPPRRAPANTAAAPVRPISARATAPLQGSFDEDTQVTARPDFAPQAPNRIATAPPRRATPTPVPAQQEKTVVGTAPLSPLLQRLTPRTESQGTPSPATRPAAAAVHDEATIIASTPVATPRLRVPIMPPPTDPQPVQPQPRFTGHQEATVVGAPGAAPHQEATVVATLRPAAHQEPTVVAMPRPPKRRILPPVPMPPQAQVADNVAEVHDTAVRQRPTSLGRVIAAVGVDAAIIAAVISLVAIAEMLLTDGSWPADRSGIEGLAVWLHVYAHTAMRAVLLGSFFAVGYTAFGARHGRTLGRAALGLTLVRHTGATPNWPWALWHAGCSFIATMVFGAGAFWLLVDARHRTFGNVLSRSVIASA